MSVRDLRRLNPALMDTVWAGDKYVPHGFPLRLPRSAASDQNALQARIPRSELYAEQRLDLYHRVRTGDTLSGIADQYRVSLAALVRANGLNNQNFIRVGQQITLPLAAGQTAPAAQAVAASLPASPPADGQYVVRRGDSIDQIARRFGVDQSELLSVIGIANRNRIYPGQVLALPGIARDVDNSPATETAVAAVSNVALAAAGVVDSIIETVVESVVAEEAPEVLASTIDTRAPALPEGAPDALLEEFEASEDSEPDLESNVLASTQSSLAADPSDYSVADDLTIEVQDMETLGHYADWLEIRTQRLRDINAMPFREPVVYGQRIKLDFSTVDAETFEVRRQAYQIERQESFFRSYHIVDTIDHVVRQGDSLWLLAQRTYDVPVWLLRQYNPDIDLERVRPGAVVKFPELQPLGETAARLNFDHVSLTGEVG
jgi:membrane-bound lytic murein transglycosylase D